MVKMAGKLISGILGATVCITFISSSFADVSHSRRALVETSTATFRGRLIEVQSSQLPQYRGEAAAYTRIPYAEPPVGELRFRRPVPKTIEGDFDATRHSVACLQLFNPGFDIHLNTSEDCLYLDLFVPEPKPKSAAVMVWIHGGAFQIGAGSIPMALPIPLVALNDVIVVTINYRLNVFGFLATGDEQLPANLGLLDQHHALLWVQENIAAFGGDPKRVTIFGESAGSWSVNFHVVSPMSAGLFSGAIMESGGLPTWAAWTSDMAGQIAFMFGSIANCPAVSSEELVTCLRQKSGDDIIKVFEENPEAVVKFVFFPVIDGQFVPRSPTQMAADGEFNRADIMIGCMKDEGNVFMSPILYGVDDYEKPTINKTSAYGAMTMHLMTAGGNVDQLVLDTSLLVFASDADLASEDPSYTDAVSRFMGCLVFVCPTFKMSEYLSAGGSTVYTYYMTHVPSSSLWGTNLTWLGATHGEDIPYVFGSPFMAAEDDTKDLPLIRTFTDQEVQLSLQVMKYWSNFAKSGNPNLASKEDVYSEDSKCSAWPSFTKENENFKDISFNFENGVGNPSPKECFFLADILPKLQANAGEMARLKSLLEEKVNRDSDKTCEEPGSCPDQ